MKKVNENFKVWASKEATYEGSVEVTAGRKKYIFGTFDFDINYISDRWECLPEIEITNFKFTNENDEEITIRPANLERIKNAIEETFNDDWEHWGVDEERVRIDNYEPTIYTI